MIDLLSTEILIQYNLINIIFLCYCNGFDAYNWIKNSLRRLKAFVELFTNNIRTK